MSIQIIHHQDNFFSIRITLVQHVFDIFCPVNLGSSFSYGDISYTGKRLNIKKYLCHAISHIFIIHEYRMPGSRRNRRRNLADQLLAGFVQAYHWTPGIIWPMIDFQDIFHPSYEFGVLIRRNFPVFAPVRLKFIFFRVLQTVIADTAGTICKSTNFSANKRTVHLACPSGASEQAN